MFDVLTIGTVTRDVFLASDAFKVVRDTAHLKKMGFPTGEAQCFAMGGKVEVAAPTLTIGGGAANAAVTFARQGLNTAAFVKVGKDKNGEDALGELRKERVTPIAVLDKKLMTAYSTLLLSPSGERTVLVYRGASSHMTRSDIPFSRLGAKWVYVVPGRIPLPLMTALVRELKRRGSRIAMDPSKYYVKMGGKKLKTLLGMLDVVKMNREEAAYLTGRDYDDEKGIFKKFDALVPGLAVMTDGAKGVAVSDGTHLYRAGIFKEKEVRDRTGAGDAFGSAFVAGLIAKGEIEHAIRLGSANATSVVEHVGAETGILRKKEFSQGRRWRTLRVRKERL